MYFHTEFDSHLYYILSVVVQTSDTWHKTACYRDTFQARNSDLLGQTAHKLEELDPYSNVACSNDMKLKYTFIEYCS